MLCCGERFLKNFSGNTEINVLFNLGSILDHLGSQLQNGTEDLQFFFSLCVIAFGHVMGSYKPVQAMFE